MKKFGRIFRLDIDVGGGEIITIDPPLTINFKIERSTMSSLNSMQIQIYNLAKKTRDRIFQDRFNPREYKRIILQAGYEKNLSTIFIGNIFMANSTRQGNNIITNIDARDGGFDTNGTLTNKSIVAKPKKEIIQDLIAEFPNLEVGNIDTIDGEFRRPVTLNGNTFELIKKYTDDKVFIDLEKVNVLKDNEAIIGELLVLNSESGLIGTPERNDAYLTVTTLFEPRITMGQLIEIESSIESRFNGQYKVIGLQHQGIISEAIGGNLTSKFNLLVGSQLFGGFNVI